MLGTVNKIKSGDNQINALGVKRKRGRRPKNYKREYILNKDKTKFIIELATDENSLEMVFKLLVDANNKDYGNEITFKDLAICGLGKIASKDLERLQKSSLTKMEKVERAMNEFNVKNGTKLELDEFLVKQLKIS